MTTQASTGQQLRVDSTRCQGHGRCYGIAPELFDMDDEGYSIARPLDVSDRYRGLADRTVAECPEGAIEIIDEGERDDG